MDHIDEKRACGEAFTMAWYTSQFLFKKLCRNQKPKLPWINNRKLSRKVQHGM